MSDAVLDGAREFSSETVEARASSPFDVSPEDVLGASGVILLTPENLGYMSGALKDFFDRCYYPCLDRTQGTPYALVVRAGSDGTGTRRAVESIATGLRWRAVADPLICRGEWRDDFLDACRELGMTLTAGLDAGIF